METSQIQPETDTRKVFVIHGRNELARKAIFDQLRTFGLVLQSHFRQAAFVVAFLGSGLVAPSPP